MSKIVKIVIGTVAVGFVYASGWWKGVNDTLNYVKDKGLLDNDVDTGDEEKAWASAWKHSPLYNGLNIDSGEEDEEDEEDECEPADKRKPCEDKCCDGCDYEDDSCCIYDPAHKSCADGHECEKCPVVAADNKRVSKPVSEYDTKSDFFSKPIVDKTKDTLLDLLDAFLDGVNEGLKEAKNERK